MLHAPVFLAAAALGACAPKLPTARLQSAHIKATATLGAKAETHAPPGMVSTPPVRQSYFPSVSESGVPFVGPASRDPLAFKYYEPDRVVLGKPMREWLRFSVAWWHSWRGRGSDIFGLDGSISRPWDGDGLDDYLKRVDVHFEFCQKLGVDYYCFHDRDISPEGQSVAETNAMMDTVVDRMEERQQETGVRLLWGTANLFSHRRYMHGGPTNPEVHVVAHAAAQVKKCLEVTSRLGGENFVLWGGRDGYQCLLNTDFDKEQRNYAHFLRMVRDHAREIGWNGQLLLEPKPREPSAHQYNFDAETTLGFLERFDLFDDYALNLEANHGTLAGHSGEHEVAVAASRGKLGSIDANRNEMLLGWDTDMFPNDPLLATFTMMTVIEQGGLAPGGLNFDAKVRRESTDIEDLFISHISGMDSYARGLLAAARLVEDGDFKAMRDRRYSSLSETELGARFAAGEATLAEMAAHAEEAGELPQLGNRSGKHEKFEALLSSYALE